MCGTSPRVEVAHVWLAPVGGEGGLHVSGQVLGQDVSWMDSCQQWGFCQGSERSQVACKSILSIDRWKPIQHNCLEIDNLFLSCSIAAVLLTLVFRHNYLPAEPFIIPRLSLEPGLNDPEVWFLFVSLFFLICFLL